MIIKTNNSIDTRKAKKLRDSLGVLGQKVVLVPYGVNSIFITTENEELVIFVQQDKSPYGVDELDVVPGFDSVEECWEYAKTIVREAGLPEDCIYADVWEIQNNTI